VLGEELRPGLRAWTTPHPEWPRPVRSFALVGSERLVLIDPLLAGEGWDRLDALHQGNDLEILLTIHWHARSAAAIRERYPEARVSAWSGDRGQVEERVALDATFETAEELPGGLVAIAAAPREEVVLWDPGHAALIAGDVLLGDGEAGEEGSPSEGLHLCPESWLPGEDAGAKLRNSLRAALELPIELVLPSHGEMVLSDGRTALERVLG
jgi:glyoxylase-like metal-dependent hydrolase (beta-lactamase superfamily II)